MRLYMGESYRPAISATPSGAALGVAYWSSSNTSVARVNSTTGEITAVGTGTATVTVTIYTGVTTATGSCSVSVFSGTPPAVMGEVYHIFNANSTKPVSPREGNVTDNGQVAQESYRPASAGYQKWEVIRLFNGYYVIRSAQNSNMALSGAGTLLKLSNIGGSNNYSDVPMEAQWTLSGSAGSELNLTARSSGKGICIEGDTVWAGENIIMGSVGSKSKGFLFIRPGDYVPTTGVSLQNPIYLLKNGNYICMPQITPSNATFRRVIWSWEGRGSGSETDITMQNYAWGTSTASYTGTIVTGINEGVTWLRAYCSDTNYNSTVNVDVHFLESGKKYFIHNRAYNVNIEDFHQTDGGNARCIIKQIKDAQRFTFSRNFNDGYITIRNCETNSVLGVADNSAAHDTLVQFNNYSVSASGQKFKIEHAEDGYVYILPKTGEGDVVKALNANYETVIYHVRQKELNSHYAFQWEIRDYNWEHTIKHYVDRSYPVYNGETLAESMALIKEAHEQVDVVMREVLGVKLNYTIENGYNYSKIDQCKGEGDISYADCNELCREHHPPCCSRDYLALGLANATLLTRAKTYVLWSNYKISSEAENDSEEYNRSAYYGFYSVIIMSTRASSLEVSPDDRLNKIAGVFIHEMAHAYGAPDHYHIEKDGQCLRGDLCSGEHNNSINKRPASCRMNETWPPVDINNPYNEFCAGCLADMRSNLNSLESMA